MFAMKPGLTTSHVASDRAWGPVQGLAVEGHHIRPMLFMGRPGMVINAIQRKSTASQLTSCLW